MAPRVAYLGLGNMGGGMATRLAESGYELSVYNRSREKGEALAELGARVADSPADAAREADVVMLSLSDQHAVEEMIFGKDGIAGSAPQGAHVVEMSTVSPQFARELAARLTDAGYRPLEARVLGAPMQARSGELRVFVGGEQAELDALADILAVLGKQVTHVGAIGMGATMKLVLNMLMAAQMPSLAEAVVFGERAGLSRQQILDSIAGTGYASPVMSFRCPMMAQRAFERPAFRLGLMRKDAALVLEQSLALGVPMPVTESACAMLTAAAQQGLGDLDVSAILAFQERMAGMNDYPWPGDEDKFDRGELT